MIVFGIQSVIGLWLIVSPWILGFASLSLVKWSSIFSGLFFVVFTVLRFFEERTSSPSAVPSKIFQSKQ